MSRAYQTEKIPYGKTTSSAYRLGKLLELGRGAAQRSTSSGARSRTDDNGASTDSGNSGGGFDSHARYESDWATYADYHQGGGPKYHPTTSDHHALNTDGTWHPDKSGTGTSGQHAAWQSADAGAK